MRNQLAVACVSSFILALCSETSAASPGVSATSAPVDSPWIQQLKRFKEAYSRVDNSPTALALARSMMPVLQSASEKDPVLKEHLAYYLAHTMYLVGENDQAAPLALPLAQDIGNINVAESRHLLASIMKGNAEYTKISQNWHADQISPIGLANDLEFYFQGSQRNASYITVTGDSKYRSKTDPKVIEKNGDEFLQMKMFPQAIKAYKLAVGFHILPEMMTESTTNIWLNLGDCYSQQGQWSEAFAYYCKSLASGQNLSNVGRELNEAKQNLENKKQIAKLNPVSDSSQLIQIAKQFAAADLFNEAIETAGELDANDARKEVLRDLHRSKGNLITSLVHDYGEGGTFRGIEITRANAEREFLLAKESP